MKTTALVLSLLISAIGASQVRPPVAPRRPITDTYHGVQVTDPYRWLENQSSPETRKWIDGENRYTDALLKTQPSRAYLKRRMTQMLKIEHVDTPAQRGNRFFYSKQRPK